MTYTYLLYIASLLLTGVSGFIFGDGLLRWLVLDNLDNSFFLARVIVPFSCMVGSGIMANVIRKEIVKKIAEKY